jgi:hypothetical protein
MLGSARCATGSQEPIDPRIGVCLRGGQPQDGTLDTLVRPTVNTEAMGVFLAEVSRRQAEECRVMVLDGAGWHKARRL